MVRSATARSPAAGSSWRCSEPRSAKARATRRTSGRRFYGQDPDHPGSLGIAISEAVETAVKSPGIKYSLGSVLDACSCTRPSSASRPRSRWPNWAPSRTSIIGCVGGGSNFAGLAFPFVRRNAQGGARHPFHRRRARGLPVPDQGRAPLRQRRQRRADPPSLHVHLGQGFRAAADPRRRLRYHGMAPLVSHLAAAEDRRAGGGRPGESLRRGHALHADRGHPARAGILPRDRRGRSRRPCGPRRRTARRSSCSTSPGTVPGHQRLQRQRERPKRGEGSGHTRPWGTRAVLFPYNRLDFVREERVQGGREMNAPRLNTLRFSRPWDPVCRRVVRGL